MDARAERRRKALGRRGERIARLYVRLRGGRVLACNLRVRGACEVDIVARSGTTLVLVEVKTRRGSGALEAVDLRREHDLRRAGEILAARREHAWAARIRHDIVAIEGRRIRYLADAF